MLALERSPENPILRPRYEVPWEGFGAFNGCPVADGDVIHLLYRAQSSEQAHRGASLRLSTIAHTTSADGLHFGERRPLIVPEHSWEAFGCEDPRVTWFDGRYHVFYTALSSYPFSAPAIKVGLAVSRDLCSIDEKHQVTPFNAKAMALFPRRVDGRVTAVLTANTDMPPAKIAIAQAGDLAELLSPDYWADWYERLDSHVVPLLRRPGDQIEVGAPPLETPDGWLLVYAEIEDYTRGERRLFGVHAALLDADEPQRVLGRTHGPLLWPEEPYETTGFVPGVVFPSGALVHDGRLDVYYGAADTGVAVASMDLERLLEEVRPRRRRRAAVAGRNGTLLRRFDDNPVIAPRAEFAWEARGTFNPAAVQLDGRVHILYRALGNDDVSVMGYAVSRDGLTVEERLNEPVYGPRTAAELPASPGAGCGCEDPRLTLIGDRVYLLYTAYNGSDARVALSSISADDLVARHWEWEPPAVVSAPEVWDKDACLFPRTVDDKYVLLHRLSVAVWIDSVGELRDLADQWLGGKVLLAPRPDRWDNRKVGACGPPVETEAGWLLLYHGITDPGAVYSVGAALLDLDDPSLVIARTDAPILEPHAGYESAGVVNNVVFPCGSALRGRTLFLYYGGADRVSCVATCDIDDLVTALVEGRL